MALELTGAYCVGGVLPALAVYGVGTLSIAVLLLLLRAVFRWRRMARTADLSAAGEPALRPGAAVLSGRVADGGEPAVRVRIVHLRSEKKNRDGDTRYRWSEVERSVVARPFELLLPSGEHVEVHPDETVELADALDRVERPRPSTRIEIAELSPGEAVIVVGNLEQRPAGSDGYRGTQMRWVMTPPRRGRMVLSTEPLGARYRSRARRGLLAIALGLAAVIGLHAISAGYHLRVWRGQTVMGTEASIRRWTTRDDDGELDHRTSASVRLPDGTLFAEPISKVSANFADPRGEPMPVRIVPGHRWATALGSEPTLHLTAIMAHAALPYAIALLFLLIIKPEWYEDRTLARLWEEVRS